MQSSVDVQLQFLGLQHDKAQVHLALAALHANERITWVDFLNAFKHADIGGLAGDDPWHPRSEDVDIDSSSSSAATGGDFRTRHLRALFDELDANGDGHVSRIEVIKAARRDKDIAEFLGIPQVISQESNARSMMEYVFQAIDTDGSKSLDWHEFASYFAHRAHEAPRMDGRADRIGPTSDASAPSAGSTATTGSPVHLASAMVSQQADNNVKSIPLASTDLLQSVVPLEHDPNSHLAPQSSLIGDTVALGAVASATGFHLHEPRTVADAAVGASCAAEVDTQAGTDLIVAKRQMDTPATTGAAGLHGANPSERASHDAPDDITSAPADTSDVSGAARDGDGPTEAGSVASDHHSSVGDAVPASTSLPLVPPGSPVGSHSTVAEVASEPADTHEVSPIHDDFAGAGRSEPDADVGTGGEAGSVAAESSNGGNVAVPAATALSLRPSGPPRGFGRRDSGSGSSVASDTDQPSKQDNDSTLAWLSELFSRIDSNGDGQISRIEVVKTIRKQPDLAAAIGLPSSIKQESAERAQMEALFQEADADDSDSWNLGEFVAAFSGRATIVRSALVSDDTAATSDSAANEADAATEMGDSPSDESAADALQLERARRKADAPLHFPGPLEDTEAGVAKAEEGSLPVSTMAREVHGSSSGLGVTSEPRTVGNSSDEDDHFVSPTSPQLDPVVVSSAVDADDVDKADVHADLRVATASSPPASDATGVAVPMTLAAGRDASEEPMALPIEIDAKDSAAVVTAAPVETAEGETVVAMDTPAVPSAGEPVVAVGTPAVPSAGEPVVAVDTPAVPSAGDPVVAVDTPAVPAAGETSLPLSLDVPADTPVAVVSESLASVGASQAAAATVREDGELVAALPGKALAPPSPSSYDNPRYRGRKLHDLFDALDVDEDGFVLVDDIVCSARVDAQLAIFLASVREGSSIDEHALSLLIPAHLGAGDGKISRQQFVQLFHHRRELFPESADSESAKEHNVVRESTVDEQTARQDDGAQAGAPHAPPTDPRSIDVDLLDGDASAAFAIAEPESQAHPTVIETPSAPQRPELESVGSSAGSIGLEHVASPTPVPGGERTATEPSVASSGVAPSDLPDHEAGTDDGAAWGGSSGTKATPDRTSVLDQFLSAHGQRIVATSDMPNALSDSRPDNPPRTIAPSAVSRTLSKADPPASPATAEADARFDVLEEEMNAERELRQSERAIAQERSLVTREVNAARSRASFGLKMLEMRVEQGLAASSSAETRANDQQGRLDDLRRELNSREDGEVAAARALAAQADADEEEKQLHDAVRAISQQAAAEIVEEVAADVSALKSETELGHGSRGRTIHRGRLAAGLGDIPPAHEASTQTVSSSSTQTPARLLKDGEKPMRAPAEPRIRPLPDGLPEAYSIRPRRQLRRKVRSRSATPVLRHSRMGGDGGGGHYAAPTQSFLHSVEDTAAGFDKALRKASSRGTRPPFLPSGQVQEVSPAVPGSLVTADAPSTRPSSRQMRSRRFVASTPRFPLADDLDDGGGVGQSHYYPVSRRMRSSSPSRPMLPLTPSRATLPAWSIAEQELAPLAHNPALNVSPSRSRSHSPTPSRSSRSPVPTPPQPVDTRHRSAQDDRTAGVAAAINSSRMRASDLAVSPWHDEGLQEPRAAGNEGDGPDDASTTAQSADAPQVMEAFDAHTVEFEDARVDHGDERRAQRARGESQQRRSGRRSRTSVHRNARLSTPSAVPEWRVEGPSAADPIPRKPRRRSVHKAKSAPFVHRSTVSSRARQQLAKQRKKSQKKSEVAERRGRSRRSRSRGRSSRNRSGARRSCSRSGSRTGARSVELMRSALSKWNPDLAQDDAFVREFADAARIYQMHNSQQRHQQFAHVVARAGGVSRALDDALSGSSASRGAFATTTTTTVSPMPTTATSFVSVDLERLAATDLAAAVDLAVHTPSLGAT